MTLVAACVSVLACVTLLMYYALGGPWWAGVSSGLFAMSSSYLLTRCIEQTGRERNKRLAAEVLKLLDTKDD